MKQLDRRQTAFKTDEITYLDRKSIQLDRMLLRLFELLRFDGRKVVRRRARTVDIASLVRQLNESQRFSGFDDHPDIAEAWLRNDLFEIMNRGRSGAEMVVGPRPFHLNAFKLANPKAAQDYGASEQVWALLYHADRPLLTRLKSFFGRGLDPALDEYDRTTPLDLETLAVLGLVDDIAVSPVSSPAPEPVKPLCVAQGRVLADDLSRLLAYDSSVVPQHVLAGYVRTIIGVHLALLVLRLFRIVPAAVRAASQGTAVPECSAEVEQRTDCSGCPFSSEIVVDLTSDPRSDSALLARSSAATHLAHIPEYVRSVFVINRLKDYAGVQAASGHAAPARTLEDLLEVLRDPPADLEGFFAARIADVVVSDGNEEEDPIVESLLSLELSSLDRFVELVCHQRLKNEAKRLTELVDSLTQKNKPGGFLRQTAGTRSPRWFAMDSHLLETLVQIAVVERGTGEGLQTRTVLIDDFVDWLRRRYGFVIYAPAFREVPPEEHSAWQTNERALRARLHEIGFFVDLSDAFNSQTLRPRYEVESD